jgi:hypothetical protein
VVVTGDKEEERMTKIYICCNDNRREVYEEKVRKYLVNAYVANTIEESTDVFLVNGEYPEIREKAKMMGKNVHEVNEELMLRNCDAQFKRFLGGKGAEQ